MCSLLSPCLLQAAEASSPAAEDNAGLAQVAETGPGMKKVKYQGKEVTARDMGDGGRDPIYIGFDKRCAPNIPYVIPYSTTLSTLCMPGPDAPSLPRQRCSVRKAVVIIALHDGFQVMETE